jgi:hypothetical protein
MNTHYSRAIHSLKAAVLVLFGGLALSGPAWATGVDMWYWLAPAKVLATGQTQCWGEYGASVDCAGTGQDGEYQKGVKPAKLRFKDMHNGTVLDVLTGLVWLKNANCFGTKTWQEALDAANTLAAPACGLTDKSKAGDWRLPNVKELESLINYGYVNPALSNAAGNGQWQEGDAFSGVQSTIYWSSSTLASEPREAWYVYLLNGLTSPLSKDYDRAVWPVRGGK